jgi:hypothetical protein
MIRTRERDCAGFVVGATCEGVGRVSAAVVGAVAATGDRLAFRVTGFGLVVVGVVGAAGPSRLVGMVILGLKWRWCRASRPAPRDVSGRFGEPGAILDGMRQDHQQSERFVGWLQTAQHLTETRAYVEQLAAELAPFMRRRIADGFVRECHGDLHLGNICRLEGRTLLFDCIEFNWCGGGFVAADAWDNSDVTWTHSRWRKRPENRREDPMKM